MSHAAQARGLVAFALAAFILAPSPARADRSAGSPDYETCLKLVDTAPEEAWEHALRWQSNQGGFPARHCGALALVALRQYAEAADRLERLAEDLARARDETSIAVLGQAGNAWMMAGLVERAKFVFDAALKLAPDDPDLLIDRARAKGENGEFQAAMSDLNAALAKAPGREDALVYRAAAARKLNQTARAEQDLASVLQRRPDNVEALLERGAVRRVLNDRNGARADWLRVLALAPDSPAAGSARAFLEELDVRQQ